ncbi:MAG: GNAT family N-acetyltransferase [Cryomorphaceae bacterium]|nr:GNAT family N-acetyltransferase [Cryomorphaceae bacterium]
MSQKSNTFSKTHIEPELCEVSLARAEDAGKIARAYENALGKDGIGEEGHEPYPDPDLFSESAVRGIIESGERKIIVIRHEGEVLGAIVADTVHEYAFEFNSMAIDKKYRGLRLGSKLLEGAKKLTDDCFFINNVTELVTHSIASQSAHIKEGYNKFLGFGYCHFPHVFFPDKPESVLWAGQLQGKLARVLPDLRSSGKTISCDNDCQRSLADSLLKEREVFVPSRYSSLVEEILNQYKPELSYSVKDTKSKESLYSNTEFDITFMPEYAHSYLHFGMGFDFRANHKAIVDTIERIKNTKGKRFIRATIAANQPQAIDIANILTGDHQFVFHSLLPLYCFDSDRKDFYDCLGLQWVKNEVVQANPLPGNTASVIKIWGYPLGLPGKIINQIGKDLQNLNLVKAV